MIIFMGRTLPELLFAASFLAVSALFFEAPFKGLFLSLIAGYLLPLYRRKLPKGWLIHKAWALGLDTKKRERATQKLFSFRKAYEVRGP
ncbi:MAG TPA: hypothetical protein VE954_00670 [Oligoflexus sp.]|uniref:hypothetical protein n=1 Tax=Oligoflexus sp. TaxID=1971216 RepID=UPI002D529D0B|nr:hypothetical protein [Oligoflexus sp.]HYX31592.1 hypothetical protein [Oligoflexus sp.]